MYDRTGRGASQGIGASAPIGTRSELYIPVWVIVYINPEPIWPMSRTMNRTKVNRIAFDLVYFALGIATH